jgi:hypothetical protein
MPVTFTTAEATHFINYFVNNKEEGKYSSLGLVLLALDNASIAVTGSELQRLTSETEWIGAPKNAHERLVSSSIQFNQLRGKESTAHFRPDRFTAAVEMAITQIQSQPTQSSQRIERLIRGVQTTAQEVIDKVKAEADAKAKAIAKARERQQPTAPKFSAPHAAYDSSRDSSRRGSTNSNTSTQTQPGPAPVTERGVKQVVGEWETRIAAAGAAEAPAKKPTPGGSRNRGG